MYRDTLRHVDLFKANPKRYVLLFHISPKLLCSLTWASTILSLTIVAGGKHAGRISSVALKKSLLTLFSPSRCCAWCVCGNHSHSCRISSAGDTAVDSPHGAGARREPNAESAAGAHPGLRETERPIPQVLQAGQDEIDAGAGAVAVTVTREELEEAFLIGQVRGKRSAYSGITDGIARLHCSLGSKSVCFRVRLR